MLVRQLSLTRLVNVGIVVAALVAVTVTASVLVAVDVVHDRRMTVSITDRVPSLPRLGSWSTAPVGNGSHRTIDANKGSSGALRQGLPGDQSPGQGCGRDSGGYSAAPASSSGDEWTNCDGTAQPAVAADERHTRPLEDRCVRDAAGRARGSSRPWYARTRPWRSLLNGRSLDGHAARSRWLMRR